MNFRKPSIPELFPHAMHQDLTAKQAIQFVNTTLEQIGQHVINRNIPTELLIEESSTPLMIDSKPSHFYVGTYIANHWKMILISFAAGVILLRLYQISNEKKYIRNSRYISRTPIISKLEQKPE